MERCFDPRVLMGARLSEADRFQRKILEFWRVWDVMMEGGVMDRHWMMRNELKVRCELKARDLYQPLHTRTWCHGQGSNMCGGLSMKPRRHLEI
jgi:hypothetical protein